MALLQRLNRAGTTILMVTHSRDCAGYAERILMVTDGRLTENDGDPLRAGNDFPFKPEPQDLCSDARYG